MTFEEYQKAVKTEVEANGQKYSLLNCTAKLLDKIRSVEQFVCRETLKNWTFSSNTSDVSDEANIQIKTGQAFFLLTAICEHNGFTIEDAIHAAHKRLREKARKKD